MDDKPYIPNFTKSPENWPTHRMGPEFWEELKDHRDLWISRKNNTTTSNLRIVRN